MELSRLRGRKICAYVQKNGTAWKGKTLVVRWMDGPPKQGDEPGPSGVYVGSVVSTKLDKSAVKRNRMRRRCREALRRELKEYKSFKTIRLLLYPRSSSLSCDFSDIQQDVRSFLSQISS